MNCGNILDCALLPAPFSVASLPPILPPTPPAWPATPTPSRTSAPKSVDEARKNDHHAKRFKRKDKDKDKERRKRTYVGKFIFELGHSFERGRLRLAVFHEGSHVEHVVQIRRYLHLLNAK